MKMLLIGSLVASLIGLAGQTRAQEVDSEEELGWSNSTDLNLVVAKGNADSQHIGLDNKLQRHWRRSNFQLKVDILQTNEADDRFLLIEPGLTWEPGEDPPPGNTTVIDPPLKTEAARFFVEGKYDRKFRERLYWSTGASWDRNEDAGILNRYAAFGGFGRVWWNREDLKFETVWALSYTDRQEDAVDPEKDQRFGGARLSWDYMNKWGKLAVYKNRFKANVSLKDLGDYSLDMTNSISVNISNHLALKVSLQGLFESQPALEDVDIVAQVELVDPTPLDPGNGDEFFRTLESGGSRLLIGTGETRKEQIDSIFKTSLVVKF